MARFVNASFVGTAGTGLSSHDSNWTLHPSYSTGGCVLSNANRVRRSNNNSALYYHSGTPASSDYEVAAPVFAKEADGGASNTGVGGRTDPTANTLYHVRYSGSATDGWQLFKFVAGVPTQLGGTSSQSLTDETGYDHKLRMVGTTIELYKEGAGSPTISVTDSAISAAGRVSLRMVGTGETDTTGLHIGGPLTADDIGGSYSLAADSGSYSLSGQAAALNKGQRLAADAGSYSLSGQAAVLGAGRTITAAQGSYALTGQAANLLRGVTLTAAQGSYLLTGQAATLGIGRAISAAQGAYTLTGQSATLGAARLLSAGQGSYALAGQDASLVYTQAGAYTLTASHGTYALTGQAAGLLATRRAAAEQGAYSLAGQSATLARGYSMAAGQGAYALTGQAATLLRTWAMAADYGSYGLTGQAVTLTYSNEAAPPVLASLRAGVDSVRRTNDVARAPRVARGRSARTNGSTR